jgi:hypothetical protein
MGLSSVAARWTSVALATWLVATFVHQAWAVDRLKINDAGVERKLAGKILVEAQDGGVLLLATDGELWPIEGEDVVERDKDDKPFTPLGQADLDAQLLSKLPAEFRVHHTAHYTICYNTSFAYAKWVGGLYERLYGAFFTFWTKKGIKLHDPELPLVVLVFDGAESYNLHARRELGEEVESIIGYYSLRTNHVTTFDLTGVEGAANGQRASTAERIQQVLSQPSAERNVATIVHEATHQLAYNTGLQTRYAAIPFWVSEGLAVYFESPDLKSTKGWRSIGGVNRFNLMQFHRYLQRRPRDSLTTILTSDDRLRSPDTATAAYAEAWALNYFMFKTRGAKYVEYLKRLSEYPALEEQTPEERLAEFKRFFGDDLEKFDADFIKVMQKVD